MDKTTGVLSILGLILGGLALYFKGKADKNGVYAVLNETLGKDSGLKEQQRTTEEQIKQIDKQISDMYDNKPKDNEIDPKKRADAWNKK